MYNKIKLLRLIVVDTLALKQNLKDQTGINTHKHIAKDRTYQYPILSHIL